MENSEKEKIATAINVWLKKGFTQTKLAQLVDTSPSYINKIVKGKWDIYPSDDVWRKIENIVSPNSNPYWKEVESKNEETIKFRYAFCRDLADFMVISAITGSVKTYTLEKIYQTSETPCYYVKVHAEYGKKDFLLAILKALGETEITVKSPFKMLSMIVEKLLSKRNTVLILDELEYLKTPLWHTIKAIIDETQFSGVRQCGIVLSGCGIKEKIAKLAESKKSAQGWEQLYSRFRGNYLSLYKMKGNTDFWTKEVTKILDVQGITDKVFVDWFIRNTNNYRELQKVTIKVKMAMERKPNFGIEDLKNFE